MERHRHCSTSLDVFFFKLAGASFMSPSCLYLHCCQAFSFFFSFFFLSFFFLQKCWCSPQDVSLTDAHCVMLMEFLRSACDKETEGRFGDRRSSMGRSVSHRSAAFFFFSFSFFFSLWEAAKSSSPAPLSQSPSLACEHVAPSMS